MPETPTTTRQPRVYTWSPQTWGPHHIPVPFAASWSGEHPDNDQLHVRTDHKGVPGLAFRDERPEDRDRHGVLWARMSWAPGTGKPQFAQMHPLRQRDAMLLKLCQVCGKPADRTREGWLFLEARGPHTAGLPDPGDPYQGFTPKPPVCSGCAILAARMCPHLGDPIAFRSRKPLIAGVFGGLYLPNRNGRVLALPKDDHLYYGRTNATRWFLASQLITELTKCTPATL
ncbi:hypothetical protein [Streptomyces sp. CA-111067]|uniref:hypothetical protein n=1 Tax=Streptomyces sp. CA-111067 TaxID=3240046 RepID=UPI003D97DEED